MFAVLSMTPELRQRLIALAMNPETYKEIDY
jgi:hypothetical protein